MSTENVSAATGDLVFFKFRLTQPNVVVGRVCNYGTVYNCPDLPSYFYKFEIRTGVDIDRRTRRWRRQD